VPTARESPTRIWERAGARGLSGPQLQRREMDKEIRERIERLSPEARALFWEVEEQGEEAEFEVPADELVDKLHQRSQRMLELPPEDQVEFVELLRAIGRKAHEEGLRLVVEGIKHKGFAKLISRAQELDRVAGRPVKEDMTLKEAIPKLEAAGELSTLEREYLEAAKHELVWGPVDEDE
jgi:hypothetical protein